MQTATDTLPKYKGRLYGLKLANQYRKQTCVHVRVTSFIALDLDGLFEIPRLAESELIGGAYTHVVDLLTGHVVQLALSHVWRQVGQVLPGRLAGVSLLEHVVKYRRVAVAVGSRPLDNDAVGAEVRDTQRRRRQRLHACTQT